MTRPLRVALLNLGVGNLRSVEQALQRAGQRVGITTDVTVATSPAQVLACDRLVIPGQGAFRDGSRSLEGSLGEAVRQALAAGKPYFGICLGLQLLFDESEEAPGARGLGVLPGRVVRLATTTIDSSVTRVPHMGWNHLELTPRAPLFLRHAAGVSPWFYFVHSYHAVPDQHQTVAATVTHGPHRVTAAVARGNLFATQFHPEKSQEGGLALLGDFLRADGPGPTL